MAISIPSYPNPYNPDHPFTNLYGWIAGISLDISTNSGRLTINLNPSEATWANTPIDQLSIGLGEVLVPADPSADPPTEAITFPTLDELMANEEFMTAYTTIGTILYQAALNHSKFVGSTIYTEDN